MKNLTKKNYLKRIKCLYFYLTNHPVSNYKVRFDNIVNSTDIKHYFNKNINMVLYVDYVKELKTKTIKLWHFKM